MCFTNAPSMTKYIQTSLMSVNSSSSRWHGELGLDNLQVGKLMRNLFIFIETEHFACREQYLLVDKESHHREIIESIRATAHEIGKKDE